MRFDFRLIPATLAAGIAIWATPGQLFSQEAGPSSTIIVSETLPDSPLPHLTAESGSSSVDQTPSGSSDTQSVSQQPAAQSSSSQSSPAQDTAPLTEEERRKKAEEQLKEQEKQRVMGVMATFNTTRNQNALPLSSGQKFRLFFKSATDPWPFMLAGVVGGIGQADGSPREWGGGVQGYAKRYGAAYSDYFIGNFFGNAVLPSLLHEDPRYFQKGKGSAASRFLWAAGSTVWCKRDNGRWGPNYANVLGNFIGTSIARAYYPAAQRTVTDTITDGITVSAEGIVGAEVIEFWPDMVRAHNRKKAEKLAREQAQKDAQSAAQSNSSSPQSTKPDKPQE